MDFVFKMVNFVFKMMNLNANGKPDEELPQQAKATATAAR